MHPTQDTLDAHLLVIEEILSGFGLSAVQATPLAIPWYNSFLYRIDLEEAAKPDSFPPQPGTFPSSGVSTMVIHFSNPHASGVNNRNRIENIVATQYLTRTALLTSRLPPIVHAVYAWAAYQPEVAGARGLGWILDEFRPGEDLNRIFPSLSLNGKKDVIVQIADILSCIQLIEIPAGVTKFGALTFEEDGQIVDGHMPILKGAPWATYAEVWVAKLRQQSASSDQSAVILGWRPNGVRARIERFLSDGGIEKMLEGTDTDKGVLVHGDFKIWNILFDNKSKRITALLDFDWAAITHPCHEFFSGFSDLGGGMRFEEKGQQFLTKAVLSGNFDEDQIMGDLSKDQRTMWEVARAWASALSDRNAIRSDSIPGIAKLQALRDLTGLIFPRMLRSDYPRKAIAGDIQEKIRAECELKLLDWLNQYTF